jgi:hypothetical protein
MNERTETRGALRKVCLNTQKYEIMSRGVSDTGNYLSARCSLAVTPKVVAAIRFSFARLTQKMCNCMLNVALCEASSSSVASSDGVWHQEWVLIKSKIASSDGDDDGVV